MKKTFLITGASKGIGLSTSLILAEQGHTVLGIARKSPEKFPGKFFSVDLADKVQSSKALREIIGEFQPDGIVNNVGLVRPAALEQVTQDDLLDVLDLNLRPALEAVQLALPKMKKHHWGRIVNVSSRTVLGATDRTSYSAAKAALISFTRNWALELATQGITVNCVAPGPVETELFRENSPPGSESEAKVIGMIPMKRLGKPDDVAAAIVFFLSDQASFITGQTLFIDGGASISKVSI